MKNLSKILFIACICLTLLAVAFPQLALAEGEQVQTYFKKIETDATEWTWNGFMAIENDSASRLWEHGTYQAGGTGECRFKGSNVELFGYKGANGGQIKVEIDGVDKGTVSLEATSDKYQTLLASYTGLTADWHTIKVTSMSDDKWHAIDYARVDIDKNAYLQNYNLALIGDIICSVSSDSLIGGGNRDFNVIRNEKLYPVGTAGAGPAQFDSYTGGGRGYFYMGYSFKENITFDKLVFQEGDTWHDGGWFSDGDVKVQVRTVNGWKDVELVSPTGYPMADNRADFGQSCEIYVFDFKPIEGDAIRIFGMTGGSSNFVSISQIEVYANDDAKTLAEYDYREATVFEVKQTDNPDTPDTPDTPDNPDNPDTPGTPDVNPPKQDNTAIIVASIIGGSILLGGGAVAIVILVKRKK